MAHVLGARGASDLIRARGERPQPRGRTGLPRGCRGQPLDLLRQGRPGAQRPGGLRHAGGEPCRHAARSRLDDDAGAGGPGGAGTRRRSRLRSDCVRSGRAGSSACSRRAARASRSPRRRQSLDDPGAGRHPHGLGRRRGALLSAPCARAMRLAATSSDPGKAVTSPLPPARPNDAFRDRRHERAAGRSTCPPS